MTKPLPSAAAVSAPDQIFQAIAEHRGALAAWDAIPKDAAHESIRNDYCTREGDACDAVFSTAPTTTAGVRALLLWLTELEFPDEINSRPRVYVIGELRDDVADNAVRQLRAAAAVLMPAPKREGI